ncbi:MAG: stage V sporulation protein AA [Bacteroidales bacterium]|nr:stage V sporulation protein AA [Clostridium sp.]MCM1204120.1 stage V sporulation protein AA [Bacteroidales bacterium]
METTVYIKAPQCIEVKHPDVVLGDFLTVYTADEKLKDSLLSMPFYTFPKEKKGQLVVSILKIIEMITGSYPDTEIDNLGEGDFILSYQPVSGYEKAKEIFSTVFICMVAFFGGGYAIMAYNTDVGAKELFTYLSMLFLGNAKSGVLYLCITYSIGLALGMILFFNHLGNKKLTSDPTPLEVQMRLYEKDIGTTIIKDTSRRSENIEIKQ